MSRFGTDCRLPRTVAREKTNQTYNVQESCREIETLDPWNPDRYLLFRDERRQPFFDLVDLVRPHAAMRVVDLGCGTGELTRTLHERLRARQTWGVDSSKAMLEKARDYQNAGIRFIESTIDEFRDPESFDLVFSNAALHWLPNQVGILRQVTELLSSTGQIAVQVPANHGHPTYKVAAEVAKESPFREALKGYVREADVLEPETYAELLNALNYREQHVRLQIYSHKLQSREEVIEWVKGALLTAYERRLSRELYREFVERYRSRLLDHLEDKRPYFFLFKRILFWGQK